MLAGLLSFPLRNTAARSPKVTLLDVGTVVAAAGMALWYLDAGPALAMHHIGGGELAVLLAVPSGGFLLIFGVSLVLLRGAATTTRRPLMLLAAAGAITIVADCYHGYRLGQGLPRGVNRYEVALYLVAHMLTAAAALSQILLAKRHRLHTNTTAAAQAVRLLPYLAIALGYGLLVHAAVYTAPPDLWRGLVPGALAITAFVVVRQTLSLRENHRMATTDVLTGIANRAYLHDALTEALARGLRLNKRVAVILIDMNGFKKVNDSLGHDAGDQLLVAFADLLRRNILGSDVAARLGGDEFAVILSNIGTVDHAEAVARRICDCMAEPVVIAGTLVIPSASLGVAVAEPGELDMSVLLRRADVAMYAAKRQQGTNWQTYHAALHDKAGLNSLEGDLHRACGNREIVVHYQPLVAIDAGGLVGVEALARWNHSSRGLIPPTQFIPLAEEIGAISQIGLHVLEESCRQMLAWPLPLELNVNVSVRELAADGHSFMTSTTGEARVVLGS